MTKQEFISELRKRLSGLPPCAVEEQISFYVEIIEDKIEDGTEEEKAVSEIGSVDYIASQIIEETPFTKIAIEKIKPKSKGKGLKTALIIIGSPVWVSLAIALFAVLLSLYIVGVALAVSLWAIEVSVWACAIAGVIGTIIFFIQGYSITALALLGLALVCVGVSILGIFFTKKASKWLVSLVSLIFSAMKKSFAKKGVAL
jgi:uncharacterized membrane protein